MKPPLRWLPLAWSPIPLLLLQCLGLNLSAPLSWPTWALVLCALFKLRECRRPFDHRLVALLQLTATGLLASQMQGLLATALQLITVVLSLSGLLAHELGSTSSRRQLLRRSLQLLLAALPLAVVLFLFVPRLPPLWTADLGPRGGAVSGLSPVMDPLAITNLAQSDAPAARMALMGASPPPVDGYWRVLVHEDFDGASWRHNDPALPRRGNQQPLSPGQRSQLWSIEPSSTKAVPWDGHSRPTASDQWLTREGELLLNQRPKQQRSYWLQPTPTPLAWQFQSPQPSELALPTNQLPRLTELGRSWQRLPSNEARVQAAEQWFRTQPFRYSLQPEASDSLDNFLFERQVGFCGHYAGGFTALMRAAGVPARVVSGYQGGRLIRPISGNAYLAIRQSDAHAWSEVWLPGKGWQPVDPTTWASQTDRGATTASSSRQHTSNSPVPWWQWLQWQWWGLDLAWTQWWLSFDQQSQNAWLRQLFGPQLRWLGIVVVVIAATGIALGLGVARLGLNQRQHDPLQLSLKLLQKQGFVPRSGETFSAFCHRTAQHRPDLSDILLPLAEAQQELSYAPLNPKQRRHWVQRWKELERRLARKHNQKRSQSSALPTGL